MHYIATALINAAAFLELSGDDVVHPDDAVRALEDIASSLKGCTPAELDALQNALGVQRAAHAARGASPQTLDFFDSFLENYGVTEENG